MDARPRSLPTGLVTFLFTDIEGSTRRWEEYRAAMHDALARHDETLRATIEGHGGAVFKTVGDAFCAAFAAPATAVEAALHAQQLLAGADFAAVGGLRVRMSIHTGTVHERDGDYFGPTLNRVARLLGIGHGGQVLVSKATYDLVADAPPPGASFQDLGLHRLKDLSQAEHVYQLVAADLAREFPPLHSLPAASNNFPVQTTSLVGREADVAEIVAMLERCRLVTVLGSGGIGKTRATLEAGARLVDRYPDGAWFVELAPLADGALIAAPIAAAAGVPMQWEGDAVAALTASLAAKHMLLVLDNAEHLSEAAGGVVAAILRHCPHVAVLVSSRQPLGVAGENLYRLPPLAASSAAALFADRATAANHTFAPTGDNAPAVAEIVARLDGIPLAIELAAARMRTLSPQRLRAMLDERFRVLTGGHRDALPRQQTLHATIDWSYELLTEAERAVFRRCGIFVDGFTFEAAADVCGDDGPLDEFATIDLVSSLVDKSLVAASPDAGTTRFRLLESTRAYALEVMRATGEAGAVASRHLAYFRRFVEEAHERYERSGSEGEFVAALADDLDNLRAAMDFALRGGDGGDGATIAAALGRPWLRMGLSGEGAGRIEAFIAAGENGEAPILAPLWIALTFLFNSTYQAGRALAAGRRAVEVARAGADVTTLGSALRHFAAAAATSNLCSEARAALAEEATFPVDAGRRAQRLSTLNTRADVALLCGELPAAADAFSQLRTLTRELQDAYRYANATVGLAETEHARGQTKRAIELVREILPESERLLGREQHANVLANLAGYSIALGDIAGARQAASTAVAALAEADAGSVFVANALEHYALTLALGGDPAPAARLFAYCDAAVQAAGYPREHTEQTTHDRLAALLRESIEPIALDELFADGAGLEPRRAIALAGLD